MAVFILGLSSFLIWFINIPSGDMVKKGVKLENSIAFLRKQSIKTSIGYPLHARQ